MSANHSSRPSRRALALLLALLWAPLLLAQGMPPAELVRDTSTRMLTALRADKAQLEKQPSRLYELVAHIVLPHFDFDRMAGWVLGKYVRESTPEQRARFTQEFRTLLVRTYARALLAYTNEEVNYLPLSMADDARDVTVRTEILQRGGPPIPVYYRMYLRGEHWMVYDVSIDGISMVANYRTTYAAEIRRSGLDGLIEQLAKRNREAAS